MHAFDYVVVLFSFVYAAAITHVLGTVGDLIIAGRRVKVSWINLGWMLIAVFSILSWWLSTWELRELRTWDPPFILFNFVMACALYILSRLTCPHVAPEGAIDLPAFHREQGRKYLTAWAIFSAVGLTYNAAYDLASHGSYFLRQDIVVLPMTLVAAVAAIFVRQPRIQAACLT
ncbi:MAG TPA: hypothetical protein VFW13_07010, partial [Phenylobacterium sp.]|nr:hypothetical protein [Phenylobacterium sp.]